MSERGTKFNGGKARMSLLPDNALQAVAMVYNYGEMKYHTHNWKKGIPFSELIDASLRHIHKFNAGENIDPESNQHHLAHAVFGLLDILEFMYEGHMVLDDRFHKDENGWSCEFHRPCNEPPISMKSKEK